MSGSRLGNAYGGTYVAYFIVAMRHPPESPFTIACTQAAAANPNAVKIRLRTRIPAHSHASITVAVPLPPDYAGVQVFGVHCNLINAAFADGSQQDYTADNTTFP